MKNFKSVSDPRISIDGESVVFVMSSNGSKNIWIASTKNGEIKQLTSGIGSDEVPRWSPDEKTLGFVSNRYSKKHAYIDDWQIKTRSASKENQIYILPLGANIYPSTETNLKGIRFLSLEIQNFENLNFWQKM